MEILYGKHIKRTVFAKGGVVSCLYRRVSGLVFLLFLPFFILTAGAAVQARIFAPPPQPDVPPLISATYSNDLNQNAIDDELESKAAAATGRLKSAVTSEEANQAKSLLTGAVEVEMIFKNQITQQQINDFQNRGGEIAYIYKAVSYGWNGRIALEDVNNLPSLMGSALVLVQEAKPVALHLDVATRTGRVRPVWASGFAGNPAGFDGSDTITIAIVDTGIDAAHSDLSGRQIYWRDFSSDGNSSPVDIIQHGSHVAGIALGTGAASGPSTGTLYFTDEDDLTSVSSGSFYLFPFGLPSASVTFSSTARWTGGGSTSLYQAYHTKGTSSGWTALPNTATGTSPLTVTNTFTGLTSRAYSLALLSNGGTVQDFVITSSVTNYPGVGDGFNRLRGVSPGCRWAAAKVFSNNDEGYSTWISSAIDDLVSTRAANKIKVMNLSMGIVGDPGIDTTLRQKVNSAVNNGIVVVISAGNDGLGSIAKQREVDDPGRAAMALTVAASNDENQLTGYSSEGFINPGSTSGYEEDYKPDVTAPGGSAGYYTSIFSVDSGTADGPAFADQQNNDYCTMQGTSMASPFAAGAAALVIDAMQQQGTTWNFGSSQHSRYVKMVLCATASETNANRENGSNNPTLQRASAGPSGFPFGKDLYEGYGMINPDAAVEAVSLSYTQGSSVGDTLGPGTYDRRVWARKVELKSGAAFEPTLTVPAGGDFDFYLYSPAPSAYGTPVILASGTQAGNGVNESFNYYPVSDVNALLVVKKISGSGTFGLTSQSPVDVGIVGSWVTGTTHTQEAGTNRALIFIAHARPSSSVTLTAVSYGGQSMTKVIDQAGGSGSTRAYAAAFILNEAGIAAASGNTFNLTWSGSAPARVAYSSVFLQNVNQTTLTGAKASQTVSGTNITTSELVAGNGDIVIEAAACSAEGEYTTDNSFIEAVELTISGADGVDGYKSATDVNETPSVTHDTSGRQSLIGFVVKVSPPPTPPGQADNPNPADGAMNVNINADLSWTAGSGATSHDVYFGTTSPGAFQGNQSNTTFDPGPMANGTTYYWRIDEKNAGGTTTGVVWSFTVIPVFTITASAGANGIVDPNGAIIKNYGDSLVFTAAPHTGYTVDKWRLDGGDVQTGGTGYTLSNITANHTVNVTFKQLPAVPTIISVPVTSATAGEVYRYDVNATGIPAPTYTLTQYPSNMAINANSGLIEWIPAIVGDVNVTVEAGNSEGTDRQSFVITVLPSDDFNDNRRGAMWRVSVSDYENAWVAEDTNRLNVRAAGDGNAAAAYVGNGWSFDVNKDFSFKADFHHSVISERDSGVEVNIENENGYVSISARADSGGQYFYYEKVVDGNVVSGQQTRGSNDGTLYISYNAGIDELYLSHTGYGAANVWQTVAGLLRGQWSSKPVSAAIGGSSEGVVLNQGDAYLDNFEITTGKLIGWPAATDLDGSGFIDWGDVRIMGENWLVSGPVEGDFNNDGIVNFLDFAELARAWY